MNSVPHGYKQTEVGVIPEDWDMTPFQFLAHIERGKFTARPRNDPKYYGGEFPFIQTGDVTNSRGHISTYSQTLNQEGLKVSKLFPRGTLFFTIAANIGDVGFATFDTACPDSLVAITPIKTIDKRWLAHELKRNKLSFENLATHNAQLNINLEKLRPYLLPVPPRAEQDAIAAALSDADALIESLEQLIAKKRQIKQGVMQELLTGKKRLPGFGGEWEVKPLVDFVKTEKFAIVDGPFGSQMKVNEFVDEGVPVIEMEHLNDSILTERPRRCITQEKFAELKRSAVYPGDIVISKTGSLGYLGLVPNSLERAIITSRLAKISLNSSRADRSFVFQCLLKLRTNGYWESISQGGTMQILGIRMLQIAPIPNIPVVEQTAIATILSDMDAELAALEIKLTKARQLKQGMMQELLTGRIRLL